MYAEGRGGFILSSLSEAKDLLLIANSRSFVAALLRMTGRSFAPSAHAAPSAIKFLSRTPLSASPAPPRRGQS